MKLFAAELLYASQLSHDTKTWGINAKWFDTNKLDLSYIEVIDSNAPASGITEKPTSRMNEIIKTAGCLLIMAIIALFVLAGAGTIIRKLFEWF